MRLDGSSFVVSSTAETGVISTDTRLDFVQRGRRVLGRYRGGSITRGCLVGTLRDNTLRFRYAQTEANGHVHGGSSVCDLEVLRDGRIWIHEHFTWETRAGRGTNVFDQTETV